MDLGSYLAAAAAMRWEWRVHDCCAFPARWAGVDLPDYSNEAEAEAMLREAGGLLPLFAAAAEGHAEPVRQRDLQPGDVGVIELPAPDATMVEVGAIWTGRRWVFAPSAGGIAGVNATVPCLGAWRPLCRRP